MEGKGKKGEKRGARKVAREGRKLRTRGQEGKKDENNRVGRLKRIGQEG
jgi:hypothetical protein